MTSYSAHKQAERPDDKNDGDAVFGDLIKGIGFLTGLHAVREECDAETMDNIEACNQATLFAALNIATLPLPVKFGAVTKAIAKTDAKLAARMVADQKAAVRSADTPTFTKNLRIAEWFKANPADSAAGYDLRLGMGSRTEWSLISDSGIAPPVRWSSDIRLVTSSATTTRNIISGLTHSPVYFNGVGVAAATKELGELTTRIRAKALLEGHDGSRVVGDYTRSLKDIELVDGAGGLYRDTRGMMSSAPDQGWGYVFETLQNGKFIRGEITVTGENGVTRRISLVRVGADDMKATLYENGVFKDYDARVDAIAKYDNGQQILTEYKAGKTSGIADPEKYDLMERQAAIAWKIAEDDANRWAKELHWRFENLPPPQGDLVNYAKWLMSRRAGLEIRFFDATGAELLIV